MPPHSRVRNVQRQTERQRETDRQRDRQTERQTDRETDRETDRQRDRQRDRQTGQTERQDRQRHRQRDRQTDRQTYRQTDKTIKQYLWSRINICAVNHYLVNFSKLPKVFLLLQHLQDNIPNSITPTTSHYPFHTSGSAKRGDNPITKTKFL